MGVNAVEVRGIADKAAAKGTFAAVPLFQRLHPFVTHARRMLAEGAFGPLSHFHFRSNRGSSARYVAWGSPWMLDPAVAGGGCLRNLGTHGVDLFLHLTGEDAQVTGAEMSSRALGEAGGRLCVACCCARRAASSARSRSATPSRVQGTDGEWKLAGRDALLVQQDGVVRCVTAEGRGAARGAAGRAAARARAARRARALAERPAARGGRRGLLSRRARDRPGVRDRRHDGERTLARLPAAWNSAQARDIPMVAGGSAGGIAGGAALLSPVPRTHAQEAIYHLFADGRSFAGMLEFRQRGFQFPVPAGRRRRNAVVHPQPAAEPRDRG